MNISIIQSTIFWEEEEKNLSHFENLISKINDKPDLIVLPEMFSSGFSMNTNKVKNADGEALTWMKKMASQKNCVLAGSLAIKENDKFYNRLYWVEENGNFTTYDKRHLFRMAKEDEKFTAGNKKIITQINDWKFCPLVCYDLRFPVWSRNQFKIQNSPDNYRDKIEKDWDYDVLIYVANWPEVRVYPWKQLLIARAIENQCYVVGVNRIGLDGNGIKHSGESLVINPRGEIINAPKTNEENIETIFLDKDYLNNFRNQFPVGLDADGFEIKF